MKLRLGQVVTATDGVFGELADIIVDPVLKTVTHVVVEPHKQHLQSRLVPVWLVNEHDGILYVDLDRRHLRQLQRVSFSEFVPVDGTLDVGDDWDIGAQSLKSRPAWDQADLLDLFEDQGHEVKFDRIPKGECEIRRESLVVAADSHAVGTVEGFLSDGDLLVALIVKSRMAVWTRTVLVPMSEVSRVLNDRVELSLTRRVFWALPSMSEEDEPEEDHASSISARGMIDRTAYLGPKASEIGDRAASIAQTAKKRAVSILNRARDLG